MTDLSSFSSNDFDACSWINGQLDELPHGETLEAFLSALGMKLHLAAQDYSEQLETAMVESMASMPRMVAEINRLEDQLQAVHHEMNNLSDHINAVDKRSITGVEELSRLDVLKSSMETCKSTLEEHARWSQLVREARQLLESGGTLSETADRIETMFRSLDVLRELPGHEERQETCTSYRQSLLSALLPNVRKELQDMGMSALQEYLYVFRKLGRDEQYEREYLQCRPQALRDLWDSRASSSEPLSQWLALFLGSVTKFVAEEESVVIELFGSAQRAKMLTAVLCEALRPLTVELPDLLRHTDDVVVAAECGHVLDEFCKRILALVASAEAAQVAGCLQAIFAGFWLFQPHYVDAEERGLRKAMLQTVDSVVFHCGGDGALLGGLDEAVEMDIELQDPLELLGAFTDALLPALDRFFEGVSQTLQRAAQLLGGVSLKSYCRALVGVLQQLGRFLMLKMDALALALGAQDSTGANALPPSECYPGYAEEARVAAKIASMLQATEVDKQSVAACALRALQAAGRYKRRLDAAEAQLRRCCNDVLASLAQTDGLRAEDCKSPGVCFAMEQLQRDDNFLAETRAFLGANAAATTSFSQGSFSALASSPRKLAAQVGQMLLQLCTAPVQRLLEGYRCDGDSHNDGAEGDVEALLDQLLPQPIVTQIGETLLSWVQDLEAFASSDALADLAVLKGEAFSLCALSAGWRAVAQKLELKDDKALAQLAGRHAAAKGVQAFERELAQAARAHGVVLKLSGDPTEDVEALDGDDAGVGHVIAFVNEWLAVIADNIVGAFVACVLAMGASDEALTPAARSQLIVDVDYLCNVVAATGIRCHALLPHLRQLAKESPRGVAKLLRVLAAGKSLGSLKDLLQLDLAIIAAIHGHASAD